MEELAGEVKLMPQILENVKVQEKIPFEELESIQIALKKVNKRLGDSGRVLLRYSGTENLERVMVEATDKDLVQECVAILISAVTKEIGV